MNYEKDQGTVRKNIEAKLSRHFGCSSGEASCEQMYKAVAMTVNDILSEKRAAFRNKVNESGAKQVYYMCMEFLLGRSLKNHLSNLGLCEVYGSALSELGFSLGELYGCEPDAGLGNGGLGRLAACFMDSLSSLDYAATGFSLCYEYGLFKQRIVDGVQVELPDNWLSGGEVWLLPRTDRKFTVRLGGQVREEWRGGRLEILYDNAEELEAIPYDMMLSGADSEAVSRLRLWRARSKRQFNMGLFSQGQYNMAMREENTADLLTKVLYPSDAHYEGKLLRLTQQYFLVSASIQSIIRDHFARYGRVDNLAEKVAIHINDTHPALCIPELMRILVDEYSLDWDSAWSITVDTISYTNHTVMPEALERWHEDLFRLRLPRIYMIVKEINERFCADAFARFGGSFEKVSEMSVISHGQVKMANLSIIGSHSVNGVSELHSKIIKEKTFADFAKMYPDRFSNVTNGIAHRRWLCYANPRLTSLLDRTIGEDYRKDSLLLGRLAEFESDRSVRDELGRIKLANKTDFAEYYLKRTGVSLDPNMIFDVQIKRLHEYKRQLLNVLKIIADYNELCDDPNADIVPTTYFFGAKAASGYVMAKRIIQLICLLSQEIESRPEIRERLRVIFLEDYNVTTAEAIIPASEISQQISMAGKEASGTGCMKFMMNGAITVGTLDGANVEMLSRAGGDNMFIFGLNSREVEEYWSRGYDAASYYARDERLMRVISRLSKGFSGESFTDLATYLVSGAGGVADPYMCLADFESYYMTHKKMCALYASDPDEWNRVSLMNIAKSGFFSADRSITEYAERIWRLERVK